MNEISLDYVKHGIEKCNSKAAATLFNVIGYLKGTIENELEMHDPKVVEYANKLYQYIDEKVSEVKEKQ